MKSIVYLISKKLKNFDDCLDFLKRKSISKAILHLYSYEVVRRKKLRTELLIRIEFQVDDNFYVFEKICGGFFHIYPESNKQKQIQSANRTLLQMLEKLTVLNIELVNSHLRFKYKPNSENQFLHEVNPYERFTNTDLILRDQLAIDRTILANERTFFAYARTSLALMLTGGGVIKFFGSLLLWIIGVVLIGLGLIVITVGVWRTIAMSRKINTASRNVKSEQHIEDTDSKSKEENELESS